MKPLFTVVRRGVHDQGIHGIYEMEADARHHADMLAINDVDDYHDFEVRRSYMNTASPVLLTKRGNKPFVDVVYTANKKYFQKKLNEHTKENQA